MLRKLIKEDEWQKLESYRNDFMYHTQGQINNIPIDIVSLLAVWADRKRHLSKLFGNQLIISKEYNYQKSEQQLTWELDKFKYTTTFYSSYTAKVFANFPSSAGINNMVRDALFQLIDSKTLINNKYTGPSVLVTIGETEYTLRTGCKAMKALLKLNSLLGTQGFEDFRIRHSRVLNEREIKGKLCLSIHPLDFWTMSDNDCKWESCFCWNQEKGGGGYQMGAVEMMNSPTALIAYVEAEKDMKLGFSDLTWNNKKWRQIFVADGSLLMGIKGYPYQNDHLTQFCLDWLKELAKENWNYKYSNEVVKYDGKDTLIPLSDSTEGAKIRLIIPGYAYNDLLCVKHHLVYPALDLLEEDCGQYLGKKVIEIDYGGDTQCLSCGETTAAEFDGEFCLSCVDCQTLLSCPVCGEFVETLYYDDCGNGYCGCCYEDHCYTCDMCSTTNNINNLISIHVMPSKDKVYWPTDPNFTICDCEECIEDWKNSYLVPGATIKELKLYYSHYHIVYAEDLKENLQDEYVELFPEKTPIKDENIRLMKEI